MKHGTKRQQIIKVADDLFYRQGYEQTSFADITSAVGISRGNLYHHFKTKDDILNAVIEARLFNTKESLEEWNTKGKTAKERLEIYFKSILNNWTMIRDHGCPVGTLCNELAKLNHSSREDSIKLFRLYEQWLVVQFKALNSVDNPNILAMDMLSWGQGVASIGNAYKDREYVTKEVKRMIDWLDTLPTRENLV
jgi:AcrR family transcriptional regulator